jgi:raffinose/stachyose/melibiose transport system substrate-binding protein
MKRRIVSLALAGTLAATLITGCGSADSTSTSSAAASSSGTGTTTSSSSSSSSGSGVVEISFPTMWVGVNSSAEWFENRLEAFNEEYGDQIQVNVEEIAGDQEYVDKIKVLYSSNDLPDIFNAGGYNLIDTMSDQLVDLTSYIDEDFYNSMPDYCWETNSRDGKIYGIPLSRQTIGYFYNKELFAEAGIDEPADTWEEFFEDCDKLLAAGITPVSMDTADSGWCTSLMLGAMIAQDDEGEEFMNTLLPTDYNTEEFINAATMIQTMFQKYTTSDAIGAGYEEAASNFFTEETAIIANGPWMVADFYDTSMTEEGFSDKIGVAAFPGNVMYNSGKIGFQIGAKDEETIEAAVTFAEFMSSAESQQIALEMTGEVPANTSVTSDNVYSQVSDTIELANNASRNINDFQSLWYANVVDEISIQYPRLAQGEITPEEFAQALTDAAQKN